MTEKIECEFFLVVNHEGNFQVSENFDNAMDGMGGALRVIRMTAKITPPTFEDVAIDIPDTTGTTEQIEVEAA